MSRELTNFSSNFILSSSLLSRFSSLLSASSLPLFSISFKNCSVCICTSSSSASIFLFLRRLSADLLVERWLVEGWLVEGWLVEGWLVEACSEMPLTSPNRLISSSSSLLGRVDLGDDVLGRDATHCAASDNLEQPEPATKGGLMSCLFATMSSISAKNWKSFLCLPVVFLF